MSNQAESKANTANMEYLNLHHEAVRLFRDIYLEALRGTDPADHRRDASSQGERSTVLTPPSISWELRETLTGLGAQHARN